jgi:glucose PTS system EIICB or EIICBA component
MTFFKELFGLLQKIGKALMTPVAVLPVAGILLGVGSAELGFIPATVSSVMKSAGDAVFANLPLIFAIGVALGLAKNDGVSALAAVVGYAVLLATMGEVAELRGIETKSIIGIQAIDTGVFGGIVIGGIAASIFNRFYRMRLPAYLGFFAGKRSVPIITAFAAIALGIALSFVWPPIATGISHFSDWAADKNPAMAFSLYGVIERALLPFGLHHIWNVPFFFEVGQYTNISRPPVAKTKTNPRDRPALRPQRVSASSSFWPLGERATSSSWMPASPGCGSRSRTSAKQARTSSRPSEPPGS